jgi:hypothetical protein
VIKSVAAAAAGFGALALCSCSGAPTSTATPAVNPTTSGATSETIKVTPLIFPPVQRGEVARVVFPADNNGVGGNLWRVPTAGQYFVKAACEAATPGVSVTYVVLDARPMMSNTSPEQRTITSGQVECDGQVTMNGASPLVNGPVQVDFSGGLSQVSRAYAVLVPG